MSSVSEAGLFPDRGTHQPLAARMRPATLDEYTGQAHLLGPGRPLRVALEQGALHSMIFWGPPGVGKTTLARLLATLADAQFVSISAVLAGVKEIRQAVEMARQQAAAEGNGRQQERSRRAGSRKQQEAAGGSRRQQEAAGGKRRKREGAGGSRRQ